MIYKYFDCKSFDASIQVCLLFNKNFCFSAAFQAPDFKGIKLAYLWNHVHLSTYSNTTTYLNKWPTTAVSFLQPTQEKKGVTCNFGLKHLCN